MKLRPFKVGTYLAALTVACLLGGLLVQQLISSQHRDTQRAAEDYNYATIWQNDMHRIKTDTAQYLIMVDLILGSDETYLAQSTMDKGVFLSDAMLSLASRAAPNGVHPNLKDASRNILSINSLLSKASQVANVDRERMLYSMLMESDKVSMALTAELDKSMAQSRIATDLLDNALVNEQNQFAYLEVVSLCTFSLCIFGLWFWASRTISLPLRTLTEMAQDAEIGEAFVGVESGPYEVRQLSDTARRLTENLSYQASHDALTDLYNRRKFEAILKSNRRELTAQDGMDERSHVLCYIDLDHFKVVNDTCGHAAGDELLAQVATILKNGVRRSDSVARLGGDEFAIFLSDCDLPTALELCNKIRNQIVDIRYHWEDSVYQISASMGITEMSSDTGCTEEVLNAADTACKRAKDSGRDRVYVFDVSDRTLARKRRDLLWLNQITSALDNDRFVLYRQFIVPLSDAAETAGKHFEILIRLNSSEGRLIFPDEFLPVVERYNLGPKLDRWVINAAIDWLIESPEELANLNTCAINLSGQSLASTDLLEFVRTKLSETGFPAEKLCFEITETAAITDLENAQEMIDSLRSLGCKFALDDFGSGLSSFAYLQNLNVDIIKIDGAFVKSMIDDQVNRATVKSINDVAKAIGKRTVAEFVETQEISNELKELGVDYAQGYHYSKPEALSPTGASAASDLLSSAG